VKVVVIGIAGLSGSGKTTVARALSDHYGAKQCTIISADNYYKGRGDIPVERRLEVNFDHPDSLDFDLMLDHLKQLKNEQATHIPTYDFGTSSRLAETTEIRTTALIIVEGILVLQPKKLREVFDYTIYVDTADDISFIRKLRRDMSERNFSQDGCIEQYIQIVRPMAKLFIEPCKETADLVLQNTDHQCNGNLEFDMREVIEQIDVVRSICGASASAVSTQFSRHVLKLFFKTEQQAASTACKEPVVKHSATTLETEGTASKSDTSGISFH